MKKSKNKKRSTKNKLMLSIIAILIMLMLILGGMYLLYRMLQHRELAPDYAPGVLDPNAVPLPDDGEKLDAPDGGGSVALSYSDKVSVNLQKKELTLYFQNPSKSTQDIVLQIIIDDKGKDRVIAQSERISVGYAIYSLKLRNNVKLKKGGYKGRFNILFYDTKTAEKAIVNTNIPVEIAVD